MKKIRYIILFLLVNLPIVTLWAQDTPASGDPTGGTSGWFVGLIIFVLLGILSAIIYYLGFVFWLRAALSGVRMGIHHLFVMRIKRVPNKLIIRSLIKAAEAGIKLPPKKLIAHHLAGGDVEKVIEAIITARNADMEIDHIDNLRLDFEVAANIDLAHYDVMRAVHDAIHYRVLETEPIRAYAKDGVELTMKCKVTIRPKIRRIVGGVSSATVLARVNEGIVSVIGRTESHYKVLEDPYKIADAVEKSKELFEDTAYIVRSVDISDIEVGKDIHAELAKERAEAAKHEAEAKKVEAISREQQMKAFAQEARVKLIEAETEVQKAMAAAFLDGKLSIHDYHDMQNKEADTKMRETFGKSGHGNEH